MTRKRGSVLILTVILLTVMLGAAALAIDAGNLAEFRHRMQTAADAGAVAGAKEVKRSSGISLANLRTFVEHETANNGFTNNANGVTVTVNHGPASGSFFNNPNYVEVLISRSVPTYLMGLFGRTVVNVGARGVAGAGSSGSGCVYALNTDPVKVLETSGSGTVSMTGCDVYVNSSAASTAMCVGSGWTFTARKINVVGGWSGCSPGTINPTPTHMAQPVTDPFNYLTAPTVGACTSFTYTQGITQTVNPGTYCGDLQIQGTGTVVNFSAGTYIIVGGGLIVKSGATANGTGVTFYTTGTKPTSFTNDTHINLVAPTTGAYAGILMWGLGDKPSNSNVFNSDDQQMTGSIYFPHQHVEWKGNGGAYTILVADTIKFTGGSSLNADFSSLPGGSPIAGQVSKAE